jgi:aminoacyl tRNA synthase complex-interacting multifunctional protein 1
MELFINYKESSFFLELLTNYCNASEKQLIKVLKIRETTQNILKLPELPILVTCTAEIIIDEKEIAEFIVKVTGQYRNVIGQDESEANSNFEFIKYVKQNSKDIKGFIAFLNKHLTLNTFCHGFHVTISDLYAFAVVFNHVLLFSDEDKSANSNIIRWVYHLQNLKGVKDILQKNKLSLSLPYEPLHFEVEVKEHANAKKDKKAEKKEAKQDRPKGERPKEEKPKEDKPNEEKPKEDKPKEDKPNEEKPKEDKPKEQKPKEEKKKEQKPKEEKKKAGKADPVDDLNAISKLDIRVGKIVNIFVNTESEKLYNEEIDIGNGEIRKIASGLKNKVDIEELRDSLVIVLCNLKARTLCGWTSHGMLLCCNNGDTVEPIRPPAGSKPGDLVHIGDYVRQPVAELNPKKNPWDVVKDDLIVNEEKIATFAKNFLWKTENGYITSESLTNAKIG